jgi:hypothetical protein
MTIINALPFDLLNGTTADATQVDANFNEVVNDVNNNAAHNGVNTDITALTALNTPIPAAGGGTNVYVAGTSGGTANAQTMASPIPSGFTLTIGNRICWTPGFTNTATLQINVNGTGLTNVYVPSPTGIVLTQGKEVVIGQYAEAIFDGTEFVLLTNAIPPTSIKLPSAIGLIIANDAVTPNSQIDIVADQVIMTDISASTSVFAAAVSVVINTSATGANGLDTGSRANSTWYNIFLISNGSTTAGLASLSATAPTLPSGYIYFMRVGQMRTDSSGNFLRTKQVGNRVQYTLVASSNTATYPVIYTSSGTITPWTAESVSAFVPPTATQLAGALLAECVSAGQIGLSMNGVGSLAGGMAAVFFINNAASVVEVVIPFTLVLESSNIYAGSSGSINQQTCYAYGWVDKVNAA